MLVLSKKPVKIVLSVLAVLVVAGIVAGTYYWQHSKVNTANKKTTALTTQNNQLSNEVTSLNKSITSNKTSGTYTAPTYKVDDKQCIKSLCITLDNTFSEKGSLNPMPIGNENDLLFSVLLTVTNSGTAPTTSNSEQGITDGSLLYTSDNLFVNPFTGTLGGINGCSQIFGNDISGYPKAGQTETGCVTFEISPTVTADSYIYGNLTWIL